jgi:hypothetical protein
MKQGSRILFLIYLTAFSYNAQAQFGLGFQFNGYSFLNGLGTDEFGNTISYRSPKGGSGLGIHGYYLLKKRMRLILSLNAMNTPRERTDYNFLDAHSNPQTYYFDIQHPFSARRLEFDYAFTRNFSDKGLCFFGLGAIAGNTYHYTMDHGIFAKQPDGRVFWEKYPLQVRKYRDLSLEAGLGLEYAFNMNTHLFIDSRVGSGRKTKYLEEKLQSGYLLPDHFSPAYVTTEFGMRFRLHKKHSKTTVPAVQ